MNPKPVIPRKHARADLDEAIECNLGEAEIEVALGFIDAVEGAYRAIADQPGAGSPRYAHELNLPNLRSWGSAWYPYLVFYVERDDHTPIW